MKVGLKPLRCPACKSEASRVIESNVEAPSVKEQLEREGYWRRRLCVGCGRIYLTEENVRVLEPRLAV